MSKPDIVFGGCALKANYDLALGASWGPKFYAFANHQDVNESLGKGALAKVYYDASQGDTPEEFKGCIEKTIGKIPELVKDDIIVAIHLWNETVLDTYKSIVVGKLTALNAIEHLNRVVFYRIVAAA